MHTDLSPHLHTDHCNELIRLLYQCRQENPFLKLVGICNSEDSEMRKCLKQERLERRKRNYEKSLETKRKLQQLSEEERKQK